jgi:C1A family cysteine protease
MRIFADNHEFVARHNAEYEKGEHTHFVGLNHLADLTKDEFKRMLGYDRTLRAPRAPVDASTWEYADVTPPETIDWVAEGAVTPVKNQKQCGSCWAFSTTGAVEGVNAIKTGKLISLSEEELISCSKNGNMGCNGGLMDNGFEWIVNNRGIDTEGEWEYVAKVEKCGFFRRHRRAVAIDGFKDVPTNDEDSLMKAVSQQPVSVAIEADHQSFQLYAGGVYSAKDCGTELDHGVLLVGYGVDPSSKKHKHFWKIKNSWGEAWGEDGYIRIAKGGNGLEGQCGVAMQPSYPTKMGTTPLGEPTLFEKGEELLDKGMDFLQKFAESNGGD